MIRGSVLAVVSLLSSEAASLPVWPLPSSVSSGTAKLDVSRDFSFKSQSPSTFLEQAFTRYLNLINTDESSDTGLLQVCEVQVSELYDDEAATLQLNVNESYELSISSSGICTISSQTVWGALHGLETFSQLLERSDTGSVSCSFAPVSISDTPRFTHRGLLIDSSRHFLPTFEIERIIDSITMNKLNVLHWHMVDAQSFPVDTPSAPLMIKGAYSPSMTYSMDQIKSLSTYASDRGVRMLLEVDIPGHAGAWQYGYPEIMADCLQKYTNINNYALNPTLDETYVVVEQVIRDIISTTGVKTFHVGGDEVVYNCWANDKGIVSWMNAHGMKDYDDLLEYFVLKVDKIVRDLGATPVHWEEVFTAGVNVDPSTVFEVWTAQSQMAGVANANFTVISAPSDVWYLDHADNTWDVMYEYDPTSTLTTAQKSLVLGGEVAMWGEHVDENNIESIVYPRANSVAERLWSDASINNADAAHDRFNSQRCRMISRGFHPSAIEPGFCGQNLI